MFYIAYKPREGSAFPSFLKAGLRLRYGPQNVITLLCITIHQFPVISPPTIALHFMVIYDGCSNVNLHCWEI